MAASESYPEDLLYHPEHDWARIDGDEAVLGVTWHAQDALGELVHYEPPDVGATVGKDTSYGEVESVKAVSDLISPLSGEVLEVNQKVVDAPETVNEDPVRRRLADPHPHDEPDGARPAAQRRRLPADSRQSVSFLSLTDADREAMLADDRRRVGRGALPRHPARRALRARARDRAGADRGGAAAAPRGARREERRRRGLLPRRRHLRPLRARRSSTRCSSAASC